MKIKTRPFECNKLCNARSGKYCMWNIDKKLVELAKDETYRNSMCPHIKEKVEKIIAKELWMEFGEVPMNTEAESIEEEWNGFSVGTFREDIWHWFEKTFHVSVAEDLMGQGSKWRE